VTTPATLNATVVRVAARPTTSATIGLPSTNRMPDRMPPCHDGVADADTTSRKRADSADLARCRARRCWRERPFLCRSVWRDMILFLRGCTLAGRFAGDLITLPAGHAQTSRNKVARWPLVVFWAIIPRARRCLAMTSPRRLRIRCSAPAIGLRRRPAHLQPRRVAWRESRGAPDRGRRARRRPVKRRFRRFFWSTA
jgi:hypothetical protein